MCIRDSKDAVEKILADHAEAVYSAWEKALGDEAREAERLLLLRAIDFHWVQHLTTMENLRTGISLHAIGQRDPLVMYRTEGHKTFQELLQRMQHDVVHTLFHVDVGQEARASGRRGSSSKPVTNSARVSPGGPKIGRLSLIHI